VTRRPGIAESGRGWISFCTADERMKSTDRRNTFAMHVGGHKALLHMVLSDADGPAPAG
jgi:hypothetical protein